MKMQQIDNFESLSGEIMTEYAGKWIAVVNGKVVAYGKSFKEVYKSAKDNFPLSKPLFGRVPDKVPIVFSIL